MIDDIIRKSLDGADLSKEEIADLLNVPLFSAESFRMQASARDKSEKASNGKAEIHAQFGLNAGPCAINCTFCAFAKCNGIFDEDSELPIEEVVYRSKGGPLKRIGKRGEGRFEPISWEQVLKGIAEKLVSLKTACWIPALRF